MFRAEADRATRPLHGEILRGVVGSTAHGTAVEGQDDVDQMGVFIEDIDYVCGLKRIEQYIYRTQPEGVRSGPGDLDLTVYTLRKFMKLAVQGNPSIVLLLWLPSYVILHPLGMEILELRQDLISKESGKRFLGYLVSQRKALTGERSKKVSRPELVEKYGFDTKFAMHALRLGYQGAEYLMEGQLSIPVREPELSILRNVREGKVPFKETLGLIRAAEDHLQEKINKCNLVVDKKKIDKFLVHAHIRHWVTK